MNHVVNYETAINVTKYLLKDMSQYICDCVCMCVCVCVCVKCM